MLCQWKRFELMISLSLQSLYPSPKPPNHLTPWRNIVLSYYDQYMIDEISHGLYEFFFISKRFIIKSSYSKFIILKQQSNN